MNYPRCEDCAFSANSVRECTDVSYIAGEGVELTGRYCFLYSFPKAYWKWVRSARGGWWEERRVISQISPKKVIVRDWGLGTGNCVSNSIYIAIHHFHRGHNAPNLPPKFYKNIVFNFSWVLTYRKKSQRQWLCKILGGKQGALWSLWKQWMELLSNIAIKTINKLLQLVTWTQLEWH